MGGVLWNQAQARGCPAFSNRPTTHTQHGAPMFPSSQKTMGESIFLSCGKCQENDVSGCNPDTALRAPSGFSHLSASLGRMSFQGLTLEFTSSCFGFECESRRQSYEDACVAPGQRDETGRWEPRPRSGPRRGATAAVQAFPSSLGRGERLRAVTASSLDGIGVRLLERGQDTQAYWT